MKTAKDSFPKSKFVWLDGKFVEWEKARVHFLTHSLHYGTGVFEGIRCYNAKKAPAVFRLGEHIERLFFSASAMSMKIPFEKQELEQAIIKLVKKNSLKECYIRPLAFFGYGIVGMNTAKAVVNVGIACWKWGAYLAKQSEEGVSLGVSNWIRPAQNIMPTHAKVSGNYVNSILAKMQALRTGFDDAVLLDLNGNVAEATGENVFFVKDNVLVTPPTAICLSGITRDSIIQIAKDSSFAVEERTFKLEELLGADEAFLTGTAAEIVSIASIDKKQIADGKIGGVTKKLKEKFFSIVHGNEKKYLRWLEFVE